MGVLKKLWPLGLAFAVLVVALAVFADALGAMQILQSPDSMPDLTRPGFLRRVASWAFGKEPVLHHDELLRLALPSLVWHELSYAFSAVLTALATALYLRTLRLRPLACCGGALAMAFAGYHFTLFNAGHRGYENMVPYAILSFALVESIVRKPRLVAFALLGAALPCGLAQQPDVMLFFTLLLGCYVIFRIIAGAVSEGASSFFSQRWKGFATGCAILVASFAIFGFGVARHLIDDILPGRETQIAETAQASNQGQGDEASAASDDDAEQRWIFSTDWSLPPEDMAEFAAPSLRGLDSGNKDAPYWGRLGRSANWDPGHPESGMGNYRQHSLYFGAPVLCLALLAIISAFFAISSRAKSASSRAKSASVFFWTGAAVVTILLALGRYGFLYRAFWHLPVVGSIRCPVKFVHLTEFSVAILSAFGLDFILAKTGAGANDSDDRNNEKKVILAWIIVSGIGALIAAAFAISGTPQSLEESIVQAGLIPTPSILSTLVEQRNAALWRCALLILATVAVVCIGLFSRRDIRQKSGLAAVCVLISIVVADLAESASRYVQTNDYSARFTPSVAASDPIASTLLKAVPEPEGEAFSAFMAIAPIAGRPLFEQEMGFAVPAWESGFTNPDLFITDPSTEPRRAVATAFANNELRRWSFWGVRAVMLPANQQATQLGTTLGYFDLELSQSGELIWPVKIHAHRTSTPPHLALVELNESLRQPAPAVYHSWTNVESGLDAALSAWTNASFNHSRTIAVAGNIDIQQTGAAPDNARWISGDTPASNDWMSASIECDAAAPGLLYFRSPRLTAWEQLEATVNGKKVDVSRANGIAAAVPVGAGHSNVHIQVASPWGKVALALLGVFAFLLALVLWIRAELCGTPDAATGDAV